MANKVQKIREEVVRLKSQLLRGACSSQIAMETRCKEEAYNEVLAILDTMQEKPVSKDAPFEPIGISADAVELVNIPNKKGPTIAEIVDEHWWEMLGEEPVSENLDSFAIKYAQDKPYPVTVCQAVKAGANWQKQKDAEALNENALLYNARLEGIEIGKAEMKQQMMKNAIDGTARPDDNEIWCNFASRNLKDGDKVKLIIIKEDEQ